MARRDEVILLKSVDLPTFGLPTSTTVGDRLITVGLLERSGAALRELDSVSDSLYDTYARERFSMIKVDIVNEVSKAADITKVKAELAVDAVFDAMRVSMQRGDRIELRGFGVFQVKPRKRGIGRNPRTGKEVRIPPGRTIRFKPGKDLQNIG